MKDRAKNILFKRIRLGAIEVVLTYKNKKSGLGNSSTPHLHIPHAAQPQALEDMRGFEVKTHALVYCDKTCSPLDLVMRMRRDILLDVLSQVGRNFTNIGNFLRDQFDPSRWAAFDALAPLKSLSTTVSSLTAIGPSHAGAVLPLADQTEGGNPSADAKAKVLKTLPRAPRLRRHCVRLSFCTSGKLHRVSTRLATTTTPTAPHRLPRHPPTPRIPSRLRPSAHWPSSFPEGSPPVH